MEAVRANVLQSVKLDSPDEFVKLFNLNVLLKKDEDLKELVSSLTEEQQTELWIRLSPHIVTATINETAAEADVSDAINKDPLQLLQVAIRLAQQFISSSDCIIPQDLFQSVLLLHGYVLASDHKHLKGPMVKLCESWWLNSTEGREALSSLPVVFLLEKCLQEKSAGTYMSRLWKLRDALGGIDVTSGKLVWDLILNLFTHSAFLKNSKAQKFLSHAIVMQPLMLKRIHQTVKYGLGQASLAMAGIYAGIALEAWKKCEDANVKASIEMEMIQDMMYSAIYIKRGGSKSLHARLIKYMSHIHSIKYQSAVNAMLVNLYKPFLWRSLHAANADVRANAAELFLDAMPLVDTSKTKKECEESLQKQFDIMADLLEEEDHVVRQVAIAGVCRVLSTYADQIPHEVTSDLLAVLFTKLAWDQSSIDVRVAVIKGISQLLENHVNYALLSNMLPSVADLIHDKSEKVKLAFAKLLIKIKHIRAFKIWKIVRREHVFARLEVDTGPVCTKLVELTYRSFIDESLSNDMQLDRCIALIESGLERSRQFYKYVVKHITLQQAVNYMLLLRKCILTCVNKYNENAKENRRPSLCTTLSNMTIAAQNATTVGDFTMIDNNITLFHKDTDSSQEEELTIDNTSVMRGLFDVISILWAGFSKELNKVGNEELQAILFDKFSRALLEFFPVFENDQIQETLLFIASFLPLSFAKQFCRRVEREFQKLPNRDNIEEAFPESVVLCVCAWGSARKLLETVHKWLAPLNGICRPRRSSRDGGFIAASLKASVQVVKCVLNHPNCLSKVQEENSLLQQLFERLAQAQIIVQHCLKETKSFGWEIDTLISLMTLHSKLLYIIYEGDEKKLLSHITELSSIINNYCYDGLTIDDLALSTIGAKKRRRLQDPQETVLSADDSTLCLNVGGGDYVRELSTKAAQLALTVILNYVALQNLSSGVLHISCSLFKHATLLCSAGLAGTLYEVLHQLTNSASVSDDCNTDSCDDSLGEAWVQTIRSFTYHVRGADFMTGKAKSSWVRLVQSADLLVLPLGKRIVAELVESFLSLLDEGDITSSVYERMRMTIHSSSSIQSLVSIHLQNKLKDCDEGSLKDNICLLVTMASIS
ncbi:condensin-2 complex subunit G2-like [Watersipora subatra]|uniref:condensin-2 complex subunit G2-like n=1 Tax=Watersipora subatra TaxID=2589382 RepID=UPI00355C692D